MRRLIGIIGAGLALGACDDGGDGATPAPCEVLGRGLAVGEQIEDLEACVVCTCHAPGEFGCQDLPFCGIDQGVTADAAPPRSARDAAPIVDAAPDCAEGTLRCDPADAARVEGCVGGRWIEAERCADGVTCRDGACAEGACEVGERTCLSATEVGLCTADGAFRTLETCRDDALCAAGGCRTPACAQALGTLSYLGCDYLVAELPNSVMITGGPAVDAPAAVVVTNPDPTQPVRLDLRRASGRDAPLRAATTVSVDAEFADVYAPVEVRSEVRDANGQVVLDAVASGGDVRVPAGGVATLLLPRATGLIQQTGVTNDTWRLLTDRPVAAYQFNPYCCNYSFSNDASLLTPVSALGREYRFLGASRWPSPAGPQNPTLSVLGSEDGTTVTLTLPRAGLIDHRLHPRLSPAGPNAVQLRLDAQEMLTLMPDATAPASADLSGTVVLADRPVAVFSGHTCTNYPHDQVACDHLEEQLVPVDTWDGRFVLVPPVRRGAEDSAEAVYWKIIARDAGTRVRLSRPLADLEPRAPGAPGVPACADLMVDDTTLVLDRAIHCEFGTLQPVQLDADGPLMVLGVVSGQATTGAESAFGAQAGDPSLFLVPPDAQYRQDYVFLAPATYAQDFLTVVAHPDTTLVMDGAAVSLAGALPVPGSERVFVHVPIDDGPHRITGDRPFGILVFAYDDFVSYAFTGGLNLGKR